jgi:hypothetical protein
LKLAFVLPEINGFIRLMLKIYRLVRYSKEEDRLVANRYDATDASSSILSPPLKKKQKGQTDVLSRTIVKQSNVLPCQIKRKPKSKFCESCGSKLI